MKRRSDSKSRASNWVTTHSPEDFRQNYIQSTNYSDGILKPNFERFFVARVQDLIKLIRLPVPPVRTTNHTVIFLTDGEATMTIGSESFRIFKHECLFVPAGQVYSFSKRDKNKGYICNFSEDFIVGEFGIRRILNDFEYLRVWGNPHVVLHQQGAKHVRNILDRLLFAYSSSGLQEARIIQSYFLSLLCEVNTCYKPLTPGHGNAIPIVNRFKQFVFDNFKSKQLVSEYASLMNLSPNHLNKVVKKISGKSPTKWIDEAIVLEAKVLLHQSHLSISEVSAEVGIIDQSYFSRLFKKYEGLSPLQFRMMIEKSNKMRGSS